MPDALVEAVPIGEGNAVPAQTIWQSLDCWAVKTISDRLNRLARAGAVRRCKVPRAGGERWIYWRDAA